MTDPLLLRRFDPVENPQVGAANAHAKARVGAPITKLLDDDDSAVRYWGAMGLLMQEKAGVKKGHAKLLEALNDKSPYVRVIAAEALGKPDVVMVQSVVAQRRRRVLLTTAEADGQQRTEKCPRFG